MKRISFRSVLMTSIALLGSLSVSAQAYLSDPRYGDTPEEREKNVLTLNFFNDACNARNYDQAAVYLKQLLSASPKASVNMYIRGATIYKNRIAAAETEEAKKVAVDSLMLIYDLRAENFGTMSGKGEDYIRQMKVRDYRQYMPHDRDGIRKLFKEAVDVTGYDKLPSDFALLYFNDLVDDYKSDAIEADLLLDEYDKLSPVFAQAPQDQQDSFNALSVPSGAADWDKLEAMYGPKFAENPNDADLIARAYNMMSRADCKSDLYLQIAEAYYAQNPSSAVAIRLATIFESKKEYADALKYLNETLAKETDPIEKSNLYIRIAASEIGSGRAQAAAQAAKQAAQLNPESGIAYIFLAQAYGVGASSCPGFQGQAVYWLVCDVLQKARELLADDPNQVASVDSQLASYRAGFPSVEDCFFNGAEEGSSYTVNCGWISGTTTVRPRR